MMERVTCTRFYAQTLYCGHGHSCLKRARARNDGNNSNHRASRPDLSRSRTSHGPKKCLATPSTSRRRDARPFAALRVASVASVASVVDGVDGVDDLCGDAHDDARGGPPRARAAHRAHRDRTTASDDVVVVDIDDERGVVGEEARSRRRRIG
jgi:hypothetical protein